MTVLQDKAIALHWNGQPEKVFVVDNFDGFLDQFAHEVGGNLSDERCPFGVLLWPSSRTLADLFAREKPVRSPQTIIELGCGVGFLSCVLARLYPDAKVYACDYEENLESFVMKNAQMWGVADRVEFRPIDWRESPPRDLIHTADLVVGADVFYDDSHIKHLPIFARQLLRDNGCLVLGDPKRFRFSQAIEELSSLFELLEHTEEKCALDQEGIEEFMIGTGYKEQKISVLSLRPKD
ncbi:MAG: methyltransferase domain-containing protein [Bdellovibrionota bacterium]